MFGSYFSRPEEQQQPQLPSFTNPRGGEFNVPFRDIAPGQNAVNIFGNAGGGDRGSAFDAFARFFTPMLEQNAAQIASGEVRPIDASGGPIPGAPQQFGPQDFDAALHRMFQRAEDTQTLNKFFRGINRGPFGR
jgi:hypothetical protein